MRATLLSLFIQNRDRTTAPPSVMNMNIQTPQDPRRCRSAHCPAQRPAMAPPRAPPPVQLHPQLGLQFTSSSARRGGGRSLWRAGVTPTRVYVITRPAGRRREPREEPVATSAAGCAHGAVARLCVRWFPGSGRGLRIPAGAGAAELGAALSLELAAAGARAGARGTSVPRGPAGGRLGRPHRAARPALAPRGCGVSACGACGSGPPREVRALRGLPGTPWCPRCPLGESVGRVRRAFRHRCRDTQRNFPSRLALLCSFPCETIPDSLLGI